MNDERPIDIWNEMTNGARESGRCMFCEGRLYHAPSTRRPVICTEDLYRKAYHRLYRHLVRNPREKAAPAEVQEAKRLRRNKMEAPQRMKRYYEAK